MRSAVGNGFRLVNTMGERRYERARERAEEMEGRDNNGARMKAIASKRKRAGPIVITLSMRAAQYYGYPKPFTGNV